MARCYCPCGARYTVTEAQLGKKAKCQKCGRVFVLETDSAMIPISEEEPAEPDKLSPREPAKPPAVQGRIVAPPGSPAAVGSVALSAGAIGTGRPGEVHPTRSFWSDVLWTFLFPASPANLIKFIVFCGVLTLANVVVAIMPCFSLPVAIIVGAWYCAFRFGVIENAVAGEDNLPDLIVTSDFVDGIVLPLVKWIGTWAVVLLPAMLYLFLAANQGSFDPLAAAEMLAGGLGGLLSGATSEDRTFDLFVYVGVGLWPIVILAVALGGFSTLYRFDLMVLTIAKTLLTYVGVLALMVGAVLLRKVLFEAAGGALQGKGGAAGAGAGITTMFVLATGLKVYTDIVIMRLIGLYYHHYKSRFAWDWG